MERDEVIEYNRRNDSDDEFDEVCFYLIASLNVIFLLWLIIIILISLHKTSTNMQRCPSIVRQIYLQKTRSNVSEHRKKDRLWRKILLEVCHEFRLLI